MIKQKAQTTNPRLKNYKEQPLHTCKLPPELIQLLLDERMQTTSQNRAVCSGIQENLSPSKRRGL
jgi:hypothetical protein